MIITLRIPRYTITARSYDCSRRILMNDITVNVNLANKFQICKTNAYQLGNCYLQIHSLNDYITYKVILTKEIVLKVIIFHTDKWVAHKLVWNIKFYIVTAMRFTHARMEIGNVHYY